VICPLQHHQVEGLLAFASFLPSSPPLLMEVGAVNNNTKNKTIT
jgi:hypothetical protein